MSSRIAVIIVAAVFAVVACKKKDDAQPKKNPTPTNKKPDTKPDKKPDQKPDDKPPKSDVKTTVDFKIDNPNIHGEEVSYKAGDTTLKGFLAYDKTVKGPRPGVLVVHEWWGHNAYVRRRAVMLAEMGYTALALDMYGDGKHTAHPKNARAFAGAAMKNQEQAVARFKAAHELLAKHATTDPKKTSAIGYCFGGGVVLHMARAGLALDGVASFHGNLKTKTPAKKGAIKATILVLNGGADPMVPPKLAAAFKKEMADAGAKLEFVNYPDAKHAFTNPAATELGKKYKIPIAYDKDADTKSWAKLKEFLAKLYPKKK